MKIATLRASGKDAALSNLVNILSLNLDAEWKLGEPRGTGGEIHKESGFNACIADVDTSSELITEITDFISKCESLAVTYLGDELSLELDIGLGLGSSSQFYASVTLPPSVLKSLGVVGIELCVTAYPISDDDD